MTSTRSGAGELAGTRPRAASRATESTRRALIEAATQVFAEHGYERGSVREITRVAGANQAAVTYHFGGKEGLYRDVLRAAIAALEDESLVDGSTLDRVGREEALALLLRQLLVPLVKRDRLGRIMRLFTWENAEPTAVFAALMRSETPPVLAAAERIVRQFLPADTPARTVMITLFWVVQQPIAFVRNADRLARPPFDLSFDASSIDALVETLTTLCLGGLEGQRRASDPE